MAPIAAGSQSETLAGSGGSGRDERWSYIDTRATASAGMAVIAVVLASRPHDIASE